MNSTRFLDLPWCPTSCVRALALSIACSMFTPSLAHASTSPVAMLEPTASTESAPADSDDVQQARALYEKGKAQFETYDYEGAIEAWTEAYASLDEGPRTREIRNTLVYNIALAREEAHAIDGDVGHLRRAKALLEKYLSEYERLYADGSQTDAEVQKVRSRIEDIERRIAEASEDESPPSGLTVAPEPGSVNANAKQINRLLKTDPDLAPRYKSGRGMRGAGIAMIVVGGLGSMALFGLRDERTRLAAAVTGSVGLGVLAGGIALTVIGTKKKKSAVDDAYRRVGVTPTASRHGAGVVFVGRF